MINSSKCTSKWKINGNKNGQSNYKKEKFSNLGAKTAEDSFK